MSNMTSSPVEIQTSPQSVPSTPSWFGEVAVVAHYLSHLGLLEKIVREVRFSRKRFGTYETIDFICVLIGYTLSGEATLKGFYERLTPFATPFRGLPTVGTESWNRNLAQKNHAARQSSM